ncbi:response regulator [Parapedobacter tibetensis]|uniref:response regulator n=1 Tax=Parapedobacter tibetensis TaxID=2972951 RepID=UPI00214D6E43|nr:response regulator transcription factor [Parapedobacter tibetensis]
MKVSILDDHTLIVESIRGVLNKMPGISEITLYTNPLLFLKEISVNYHPDLLITDLIMPSMGGLDLIEHCKTLLKDKIKIVVLSSINNAPTVRQALRMGVNGYLAKDATMEELAEAVREIMQGKQYIGKSIQKNFLNSIITEEQVVLHLTPREKEVLELLCSSKTVKEIAHELKLSANTVHSYHKNILRKFKLNRTVDLVSFAIQHGLHNPYHS